MTHQRSGSLIINVCIALALILVVMNISVQHSFVLHRYLVRTELEKMYALFFFLQQRAIATNQQQELCINIETHSFTYADRSDSLASGVIFGYLPHTSGPPSKPNQLITAPITFANNCVIFYPDGTVQAGTIYFTDERATMMYAVTTPVATVSYLRKYRYEDDGWVQIP